MTHILDDEKTYKQLDQEDFYNSLSKIGRQFESGWHSSQFAGLDFEADKIKNIIFVGMGGSGLAGDIAKSLSPFLFQIPFEVVSNYRIPAYSGKSSLVILSSYSGNTEEVLSCAQDAKSRGCKIVAITTGGRLMHFATTERLSFIELDEKFNANHVPRSGIGLSLGSVLGLFTRLNPNVAKYFEPKEVVRTMERVIDMVQKNKDMSENPAKALAAKHKGQGVIIFSANHLSGIAKLTGNFINETSKTFCSNFYLPDLNHHLLEGLVFPTSLKDSHQIIIINSTLYPEIVQRRIQITRDILIKQKYKVTVVKPETTDPILQVFESLVFFTMFSYYLSIVNKANPATNPWVDYLKKELTSANRSGVNK